MKASKQIIRRVFAALLCGVMLLSLFSCGKDKTDAAQKDNRNNASLPGTWEVELNVGPIIQSQIGDAAAANFDFSDCTLTLNMAFRKSDKTFCFSVTDSAEEAYEKQLEKIFAAGAEQYLASIDTDMTANEFVTTNSKNFSGQKLFANFTGEYSVSGETISLSPTDNYGSMRFVIDGQNVSVSWNAGDVTLKGTGKKTSDATDFPDPLTMSDEDYVNTGDVINVQIVMENDDTMSFELYPDLAPITVNNFVTLAKEGFYDGLIFHRVVKDFVIQGGDPNGNGTGGSENNIKGEFVKNGVQNDLHHKQGVISMARSSAYDSASSQFFIVTQDSDFLDGSYAAFGRLTDGLDVLLKIADVKTDSNDKPLVEQKIKTIRVLE